MLYFVQAFFFLQSNRELLKLICVVFSSSVDVVVGRFLPLSLPILVLLGDNLHTQLNAVYNKYIQTKKNKHQCVAQNYTIICLCDTDCSDLNTNKIQFNPQCFDFFVVDCDIVRRM